MKRGGSRFAMGFRETFAAIFSDRAALITLIGAVVLYSFFYPVAYRHQVATQLPVLVVDLDRSAMSRELLRRLLPVPALTVQAQAASLAAAQQQIARGEAEGILLIESGFERDILRGGQGSLALYGNGAFLGRAGTVLQGMADAIAVFAADAAVVQTRFQGVPARPAFQWVQRPLFNTREGYGSAIVPGVAELIVQQTLMIGMVVMAGTRRERLGRLRFSRWGLSGILVAFFVLGLLNLLYYNGFVFWFQDYPRGGSLLALLCGGALFIAAVVGLAAFVGSFFRTRERAFQLITVTTLPMFFLSNLSWPLTSTPEPLQWLARLLPSTAAINALVKINTMGASLAEAGAELCNLAALALLYGSLAYWRLSRKRRLP